MFTIIKDKFDVFCDERVVASFKEAFRCHLAWKYGDFDLDYEVLDRELTILIEMVNAA